MMNVLKHLLSDRWKTYIYLMNEQEQQSYQMHKKLWMLIFMGVGLVSLCYMKITLLSIQFLVVLTIVGYKLPYLFLRLRHNQQCNRIVDAIPLWVNMLYSLIGENNIYNAILLSYEDAPISMKKDLSQFIEEIRLNNSDKDAYLNFLSRYKIEHFKDIMMKLFEFRNLSKDKLKYEISILNESLSGIEVLKRERRYKNELFTADSLTLIMMCIPCIYMFFVSLILSSLMLN